MIDINIQVQQKPVQTITTSTKPNNNPRTKNQKLTNPNLFILAKKKYSTPSKAINPPLK